MDPVTLAMGMQAFAKILGGVTNLIGARTQAKQLKWAANQARAEGTIQSSLALRDADRATASAAVQAAANGGGAGVGQSAMEVMADLEMQGMHNARTALYQGESEAVRYLNEAKVVKKNAELQLVSSVVDAGASFLGGSSEIAAQRRAAGQSSRRAAAMPRSSSGFSAPTFDPNRTQRVFN